MKVLKKSALLLLIFFFLLAGVSFAAADIKEHYNNGVQFAIEGKFLEARDEFNKGLKIDPEAHFTKLSLEVIKDAIDLKIKKEAVMHFFKGTVLGNYELLEISIVEFTKALEADPKFLSAYFNRGVIYQRNEQFERAIDDYTKAIEINPKFADSYYNRGLSYQGIGQFEHAISDFKKAIEINPKFARSYDNLGFIYMVKLDEPTKGCVNWNKACELGVCGNYNLAKKDDLCNLSIEELTKALEADPKFLNAYFNRGLAYSEKNQNDLAIADYSRAIEIKPEFSLAHYNRGVIYKKTEQFERAISDFTKAIDIDPKLAKAYDNLGFIYMVKLDEPTKGCVNWNKACELGVCEDYNLAKKNNLCK